MNRYAVLFLATLIVVVPLDFLFLGILAKGFFASQVGEVLGEVRIATLFYLLYVAGIVIFVSGPSTATWQSTTVYGALFGLFCYATFDLMSLAMLDHWRPCVAAVDVARGAAVTAISATVGLLIANSLAPKG